MAQEQVPGERPRHAPKQRGITDMQDRREEPQPETAILAKDHVAVPGAASQDEVARRRCVDVVVEQLPVAALQQLRDRGAVGDD